MELSKFDVVTLQESKEDVPVVTVKFVLEAEGFRRGSHDGPCVISLGLLLTSVEEI
jgi:hypothetical protein